MTLHLLRWISGSAPGGNIKYELSLPVRAETSEHATNRSRLRYMRAHTTHLVELK
jgi:hypothetical protein